VSDVNLPLGHPAGAAEPRPPGDLMRSEILEQPRAWERLLGAGWEAVASAARLVREQHPAQVVLLARGSSDNAAVYGQYLMQTTLKLPTTLATPSTHTILGAGGDSFPRHALVLAISQSGASTDLIQTLAAARSAGCLTMSITNNPDSPLAQEADAHISLLAGPERSVAATKTYTTELLALRMLTAAVASGERPDFEELQPAEHILLTAQEACRELADRLTGVQRMLVVGRGYSYASAREAALKLMETSYLMTQGLSAADAKHGPIAVLDPDTPLLAFASRGPASASVASVVDAARAAGAPVEIIGDGTIAGDSLPSLLPPGLAPDVVPLLEILPAQLFALELALQSGKDPDRPRGLSKVTSTT
jgi:glucosamine--fructose-6-phosphate aminotransferase (isomerizing)